MFKLVGRLMIAIASNGHLKRGSRDKKKTEESGRAYFLTQIPQPIHRISEIKAILSVGLTSMHSFPGRISLFICQETKKTQ